MSDVGEGRALRAGSGAAAALSTSWSHRWSLPGLGSCWWMVTCSVLGRGDGILHDATPVPPALPHRPNIRLNWPGFPILGLPHIPDCQEVFFQGLLLFRVGQRKANLLLSPNVTLPLHSDTQQLLLNTLQKHLGFVGLEPRERMPKRQSIPPTPRQTPQCPAASSWYSLHTAENIFSSGIES